MRLGVSTAVLPCFQGVCSRREHYRPVGEPAISASGTRLEIGLLAACQGLLGRQGCEEVHGPGDDSGPAGLVAGAEAGPVVAVEILVEQEAIAPVRVRLELPGLSIDRATALLVFQKDVPEPAPISSAT